MENIFFSFEKAKKINKGHTNIVHVYFCGKIIWRLCVYQVLSTRLNWSL